MRITPLVLHAGVRLPRLTSLFSDRLDVTLIEVDHAAGRAVVRCAAPHGLAGDTGICVSEAQVKNIITNAVIDNHGDLRLTTDAPHNFTGTPEGFQPFEALARLTGFASPALNGWLALKGVYSDRQFSVARPETLTGVPLTGAEAVLENLDHEITGWHRASVLDAQTLTFPLPAAVTRSYQVERPAVATAIRVAGTLDFDLLAKLYSQPDGAQALAQNWLYIAPADQVLASKDRRAKSSAVAEIGPGTDYRRTLLDGFSLFAALPTDADGGVMRAVDLAQEDILAAVLAAFNGLRIERPKLCVGGEFVAQLTGHQSRFYNGAYYIHEYMFEAPVTITAGDSIRPVDWTGFGEDFDFDAAGGPANLYRTGAVPARKLMFTPGLFQQGQPEPLTANVPLP